MFQSLSSEGFHGDFPLVKKLWKTGVTSKVAIFCWFVLWGKVNTHELMLLRNPQLAISPGWCYMCKNSNEDIKHLFLHCPFAPKLWSFLLKKLGVSWVLGKRIGDIFYLSSSYGMCKRWRSAVTVASWLSSGINGCRVIKGFLKDRKTGSKIFGTILIIR